MDFLDRKLTDVSVFNLERVNYADGVGVSGNVRLSVSNYTGEDQGPHISVEVGKVIGHEPTLQEAEDALISAAINLIKRFAQETPENVKAVLASKQPSAYFNKSEQL